MYLKINGSEDHYSVDISSFTTQHGHDAVRFIGDEIPETDKGFKLYNDDDTVMVDLSRFKYIYKPNEYSVVQDIIDEPSGNNEPLPPSAFDRLNSKVNRLSSQVSELTPYTDTKTAYYGEKEKTFYGVPEGNTSVFFTNYNGDYTVNRIADRLTVSFGTALEQATDITISIQ